MDITKNISLQISFRLLRVGYLI